MRLAARLHILPILAIVIAAFIGGGCATHVYPSSHPADPVTVYLTDYRRHSSILLPVSGGGYDEYAFGDWDWFALGKTGPWNAIAAMFGAGQSTIGRRHLSTNAGGSITMDQLPECERLTQFQAPKARVDALNTELDTRFRRPATHPVYSKFSGLEHAPDDVGYWGFHNCNHETAAWLRALGCNVRGLSILSNFQVHNPDGTS